MPVSANPRKRDFYVYQFSVGAYPFYVGIGRSKRGPDRERYVRSLLKPWSKAKLDRSSLCVRVMASLIRRRKPISYTRLACDFNRQQALAEERRIIDNLVGKGYFLTNWQHNPHRHKDVNTAMTAGVTDRVWSMAELVEHTSK